MTENRIPASEAGTWLEGSQGWNNNWRVIDRALAWGWNGGPDGRAFAEEISSVYAESDGPETITWEGEEISVAGAVLDQGGLSDMATEYLDSIAPAGYRFEWDAGELSMIKFGRDAVIQRSASGRPDAAEVAKYLPYNYEVVGETDTEILITGEDDAGWSLDGYVIPRLGSGWITCREVGGE